MSTDYYVLAFYCFTSIERPEEEVAKQHAFFKERDVKCRMYISHEGINAQMSASAPHAEEYMSWMRQDPRFREIDFKIHHSTEHVFPKATVKVRRQLVALDMSVDMSARGERVSPERWKAMLEARDADTLLLDVRNDYEWEVGHFEGAELPLLKTFREFGAYAKQLCQDKDRTKTKVMMYCTGGIRCEIYSALLKQEGMEQVFQLDGGVIGYGLRQGTEHWLGRLFVFDDRLAVPIVEGAEPEVISSCSHCGAPSDVYYNCADMDCNELFLACAACAEAFKGCCSRACMHAPRVRAFEAKTRPKPFRKCQKRSHVGSSF